MGLLANLFSGNKKKVRCYNAEDEKLHKLWEQQDAVWKNAELGKNLSAEVAKYTAMGYDFSDPRLFHQKLMENMLKGEFPFDSPGNPEIQFTNTIHETVFAGGDPQPAIEEYIRKRNDAVGFDTEAYWNRRRHNS